MGNEVLLEMKNICKSFFSVKALENVNLEVRYGEVHALLGENGAGKSTLIKILGGIYVADQGDVIIDGKQIDTSNVNLASKAGISVVHQELCLSPNISVAANIFLGRELRKGRFFQDTKRVNKEAQQILDNYGLNLKAEESIRRLTVAQQQMVEIAKAMSVESKILVLDEPTSSLTEREVVKLFEAIEVLKKRGIAIIYISHRLDELKKIADRVTILRDGRYIETCVMKDVTTDYLISKMVGRELTEMYSKPNIELGDPILQVNNINAGNKVKNASFELKQGEILGFYGLVGSGRTELMETIFGLRKKDSGSVLIEGKEVEISNAQEAINKGIALVPEDRKLQGAILGQGVDYNITLVVLKNFIKGISINRKKENAIISDYIKKLDVKAASQKQLVRTLSGGNQQKVILAKWLASNPRILILDEPTRGIDVGAKKEIYKIMSDLVKEGVSIIMVSSELPEIIYMSNRVIVMKESEIVGEIFNGEMTEEAILHKAAGGKNNAG